MVSQNESSDRSESKARPYYRGGAWTSREAQAAGAYRHVEPLAVASLIFGGLSFLPMFGWIMSPIPIAGVIFGLLGLRQIDNFPGERTGRKIAIAGLVLSILVGLLAVGYYGFFVVYNVPIGYTKVTFSEMQPDQEMGEIIPEKILKLEGKYIYVKGFMYPGRRSVGIQQFVLVPTRWHCKFCQRELASTEMIKVTMVGDEMADFTLHMVGVGGKLEIDRHEALRPLGGMPYHIEADVFR